MSQAELLPTVPCPFVFKNYEIRTIQEDDGTLWFAARDVCAALGVTWSGASLKGIPSHWQGMLSFNTPSGNQRLRALQEPGVYKLAFRSNKPDADAFTNWIASEVVPSIRKTGGYTAPAQPVTDCHQLPPTAPRLSTVEDRAPLNKLVGAWVSLAPITKRQAWEMIHAHFHVDSILHLNKNELPIVMSFVQARIDALPKALPTSPAPALPALSEAEEDYSESITRIKADLEHLGKHMTGVHHRINLFLRGGGYSPRHEPLIQAVHSMTDAAVHQMGAVRNQVESCNRLLKHIVTT